MFREFDHCWSQHVCLIYLARKLAKHVNDYFPMKTYCSFCLVLFVDFLDMLSYFCFGWLAVVVEVARDFLLFVTGAVCSVWVICLKFMIGSTPEIYQFAPAKGPSQKEDLLPTMIFQGLLLLIFRGVPCEKYVKIWRHRKYVSGRGCFFKLFILFSSWTCVFLSIKTSTKSKTVGLIPKKNYALEQVKQTDS